MENILFWIEFFKDDRFSFRFKLANLIMNDYLRNYLAVGCLVPLSNALEYVEPETFDEKYMHNKMQKAYDTIKEIFVI